MRKTLFAKKASLFLMVVLAVAFFGSFASAEVLTIDFPSDDSWVETGNMSKNHGDSKELLVGFDIISLGKENERNSSDKSFIKFNLTSAGLTDVIINSAKLRLFADVGPNGKNVTNLIKRVLNDWDEDNITFENQPNIFKDKIDSIVLLQEVDDIFIEFDVTSDVRGFLNGNFSNFGWAIEEENPLSDVESVVNYDSKESDNLSQTPKLIINFTNASEEITIFPPVELIGPDELLELLSIFGSDCGNCSFDFNNDDVVDKFDLDLLLAAWDKPLNSIDMKSSPDLDESGIVGPGDLLALLASWNCTVDCAADFNEDGIVNAIDAAIMFAFWGEGFVKFDVDVFQPKGGHSGAVPMDFAINSEGEFSCFYRVESASEEEVVGETELPNCQPVSISGLANGNYVFLLTVTDSEGDSVVLSSEFSVNSGASATTTTTTSSNSGGGSGGGNKLNIVQLSESDACFTDWVCGEWSECSNGQQARSCSKETEECFANGFAPETTRACGELESSLNDGVFSGLGSRITGAVVGADGSVRVTGLIMFLALLIAVYAFLIASRHGKVSKGNKKKNNISKTNGKKVNG